MGAYLGKLGVEFRQLKQNATVAFTTMLGSGEKAQSFLDNLYQFALTTPFAFPT